MHRTGLERIQTDPGEFLSIIPEKTQFFLSFPIILAAVTLTAVVLIWTQEGTRIPFRELQLCHKKKEERISGKSVQTGLLFNHFDFTFENLETLRNVERGSAFAPDGLQMCCSFSYKGVIWLLQSTKNVGEHQSPQLSQL